MSEEIYINSPNYSSSSSSDSSSRYSNFGHQQENNEGGGGGGGTSSSNSSSTRMKRDFSSSNSTEYDSEIGSGTNEYRSPLHSRIQSTSNKSIPPGSRIMDKSCMGCRKRKVKCNRNWPTCNKCAERGQDCDFGSMMPASVIEEEIIIDDKSNQQTISLLDDLSQRIHEAEEELKDLKDRVPLPLSEIIRTAFISSTLNQERTFQFLESHLSVAYHTDLSEDTMSWSLARSSFARALTLHLINSFFVSCCAYLPAFQPWATRLDRLRGNLDSLKPSDHVAVLAFCAMGARASPHSALLGIPIAAPGQSSFAALSSTTAAGIRRENACQSIHKQALDSIYDLGVLFESNIENLESILVVTQMLIFNEVIPEKSRLFATAALTFFKDLVRSHELDPETKRSMIWRLSLPLLCADSIISAYGKKYPLISKYDLLEFFDDSPVRLPDLTKDKLQDSLQPLFSPEPSHDAMVSATTLIACWLAQCQRDLGDLGLLSHSISNSELSNKVRAIWSGADQVHIGIVQIQTFLVDNKPTGCGDDNCSDLHLRFDTRLDRDLMDVIYVLHRLISERYKVKGGRMIQGEGLEELHKESEARVRRSLKLTAFYSQLYISSQDHHMVYHVFFQLEIFPQWTDFVLQRFGEENGPSSIELEVSETELDWFEQGLLVGAFYHPVAQKRLSYLQEKRRTPRFTSNESTSAVYNPATAIHHTSSAINDDGSTFSMPQAITNLLSLNSSRGERRFDDRDDHTGTEVVATDGIFGQIVQVESNPPNEGDEEEIEAKKEEVSPMMEDWLSPEGSAALSEEDATMN